jgi:two-component system, cell cycle sensor histidine kinase and response regulator CckA
MTPSASTTLSVFDDAADAMLILDGQRRIVDANPAACTLFRQPIDGLLQQRFDDLLVDGSNTRTNDEWRELMAFGEAKGEHRVLSPPGEPRIVECSYRASLQADRHLCIARDITERRRLEERLFQAEKIESVGRLAGGIAHDFNNLLTAILGYTELLLGQKEPGHPDRADLLEIQKAGQRAAALTQQLLAYSRKQVLMPAEVDLNQTVTQLKGMLTRLIREDISLACDLSPEPAVLKIDPTQLEQVIINLVLNARDALPAGGTIKIEVARVRPNPRELASDDLANADECIRLRVADDGVGMTADVRAHLFEPFFTTKEIGKGTGLGLASVYGIVSQSNGSISVESEPDKGSVFTMHFPAVAMSVDADDDVVDTQAVAMDGGMATILLVEDEDAVRAIASAVLRRHGYQVLEAATPRIALELFERYGSAIRLLLTDVVMPELSGPALAQRLITARPELRVLFISGYADVASLDTGNPNINFLSKPFQASKLATKVREALTRSNARTVSERM